MHLVIQLYMVDFHLYQNVRRHVQEYGLQEVYASDDKFAQNIKMLTALAYVPVDRVIEAFEEFMGTDFYNENSTSPRCNAIQQLTTYFQNTYVYRITQARQQAAPFYEPIVFGKVIYNLVTIRFLSSLVFE